MKKLRQSTESLVQLTEQGNSKSDASARSSGSKVQVLIHSEAPQGYVANTPALVDLKAEERD